MAKEKRAAQLSASILSADFSKLANEVELVEKGGAGFVHVDVMDGHFVPNISFGSSVMKSLLGKTKLPFDVHLMIENPDKYVEDFITENTEFITVHAEVCTHIDRTIEHIKEKGVKAGVAINPGTPVGDIKQILSKVDLVLIMSVNPGFGGQKFIDYTLDKVKDLAKLRDDNSYNYDIEIDGGVDFNNAKEIIKAGVDLVVAGSAIYKNEDVLDFTKKFCEEIH